MAKKFDQHGDTRLRPQRQPISPQSDSPPVCPWECPRLEKGTAEKPPPVCPWGCQQWRWPPASRLPFVSSRDCLPLAFAASRLSLVAFPCSALKGLPPFRLPLFAGAIAGASSVSSRVPPAAFRANGSWFPGNTATAVSSLPPARGNGPAFSPAFPLLLPVVFRGALCFCPRRCCPVFFFASSSVCIVIPSFPAACLFRAAFPYAALLGPEVASLS